jgi:co-chaperonin GroES (HSP10)
MKVGTEKPLQPLHDRVLVRIAVKPKMSAGGIHLPGTDERLYNEGEVIGVGPKVTEVAVGDVVIWEVFKGQAPGHFDEGRWMLKESEVLAKVVTP